MKRLLTALLVLAITASVAYSAPRPVIKAQTVTPHMLINSVFTADSCVATGLRVFANKTFMYMSVMNIGDTAAIQSSTWSFVSKPAGSTATLVSIPSLGWYKFRADLVGTYEVKASITTSTGTKDSTFKFFSSNFVGTGGFYNVPAQYPNCMSCHGNMTNFQTVFNKWKNSGHANIFRYEIDSGAAYYSTSCMKCHTTGYDHNLYVDNGGFDDKARTLGWNWTSWAPPKKGNWDSLKNKYPSLVAFASIGCENCHGAGSEHSMGGDTNKIQISYDANACNSCHD
ncbi:MAG: cytochrome c family protein, partial [Ignavibacteria bacterium]|nr:cytochrome c family protein [Ignavibacteria bacterium]